MQDKNVRMQGAVGKEVILLKDGSFQGKLQAVLVETEEKRVRGVNIRLKKLLNNLAFVPLESIWAFGEHGVTIKEEASNEPVDEVFRDVQGMPVITLDGTLLGKISDFYFDPENGELTEYILSDGVVKDRFKGRAVMDASRISLIGKDVVLVEAETGEDDLQEVSLDDEDVSEWGDESADPDDTEKKKEGRDTKEFVSEKLSAGKKNAEKIWAQTLVTAKALSEKLLIKAGELGTEAKDSLEKLNTKREEWQERLKDAKKVSKSDLGDKLLAELRDKEISQDLYTDDNELIIVAGGTIDDAVIKKAIETDKVYDLMQLAAAHDVESHIIEVERKESEQE